MHVSVNGLNLYYETHGTGEPLILLHGAVGASEMFAPVLPSLAAQRQVIAVHLQAHGKTSDADRPMRFESMANDIAELIRHLGLTKTDVLGYSFGGAVALRLAVQHPELVRKLILISVAFKKEAFLPEVRAQMAQMGPDAAVNAAQRALFTKLGDLLRRNFDWTQEIDALTMPVLLVFADADQYTLAHIADFYRALGGGQYERSSSQLAILPDTTHYDVLSSPVLGTIVNAFLDR